MRNLGTGMSFNLSNLNVHIPYNLLNSFGFDSINYLHYSIVCVYMKRRIIDYALESLPGIYFHFVWSYCQIVYSLYLHSVSRMALDRHICLCWVLSWRTLVWVLNLDQITVAIFFSSRLCSYSLWGIKSNTYCLLVLTGSELMCSWKPRIN